MAPFGGGGQYHRVRISGATRRVAGVQLSLTRSSYRSGGANEKSAVTVRRIDDLMTQQWTGETLGFMHLDVQGGELDALQGAMATLARDQARAHRHLHTALA